MFSLFELWTGEGRNLIAPDSQSQILPLTLIKTASKAMKNGLEFKLWTCLRSHITAANMLDRITTQF